VSVPSSEDNASKGTGTGAGEPLSDEGLFRELAALENPGEAEVAALLTRDAIVGYEISGEISTGGQGTVYLARQVATGRDVALKVLSRGTRAEPRDRLRFEREVELACRLTHPNIVSVFECGVTDGRSWYAMELADGVRLDQYLENNATLGRADRLALAERIVSAIAYAHRCGVIHRDLKPANILVDRAGVPRVVDFGLALAWGDRDAARMTATGEFLGTLEYCSPEQVTGAPVDTRTDVHALGLLVYEILTGRLPWETSRLPELLSRVAEGAPERAFDVPHRIDRDLRALLQTALAKDPAHRYATADALLRDLQRYRAHRPLEAREPSMAYVLRMALARNRARVLVAAAVLLVLAAASGFALRQRWRAETHRRDADLARQLMSEMLTTPGPMNDGAARLAVLEDSLARLDSRSAEASPDVHATLLLALGESHAARLHNEEAEDYLRRAVGRFEEAADTDGGARASASLARVLCMRGDSEAVDAAERVLAHHRQREGATASDIAGARRLLARTLISRLPEQEADRARARELLGLALEEFVSALGDDDPEVAATRVQLARVAESREEALRLCREALEVFERSPGEARRTIECLDRYAGLLAVERRIQEADAIVQRSAQLTQQTYGERHTVDHLRRRARLERMAGNALAAENLARAALSTEVAGWIERRPDDARISNSLPERLRTEAAAPYVETFALLRELRGKGDFALSSWMNELASLQTELEQPAQAEALLRESLEIHCRVYGLDCPNRMRTLVLLAGHLGRQGRVEEALDSVDVVLETCARLDNEDNLTAREARALRTALESGPLPVTQ